MKYEVVVHKDSVRVHSELRSLLKQEFPSSASKWSSLFLCHRHGGHYGFVKQLTRVQGGFIATNLYGNSSQPLDRSGRTTGTHVLSYPLAPRRCRGVGQTAVLSFGFMVHGLNLPFDLFFLALVRDVDSEACRITDSHHWQRTWAAGHTG